MPDWLPPDAAARARIASDLATSLLVEAGAGSGKTTAMVGRMVALVRTGAGTVDQVAAVTFTRKAAGELRERFQEALERAFRESADAGGDERERLARGLHDLDRAFIGTIHAFSGRLLRERPFDAGVPPGFREVTGADEERVFAEGWSRFLEHLGARRSRLSGALEGVGLRAPQLRGLFREVAGQHDVRFAAPAAARPDGARVAAVRAELDALLSASLALLPAEAPAAGWDDLQSKLLSLRFSRRIPGWDDSPGFYDALAIAVLGKNDVVQNRWGDDKAAKQAAKALSEQWTAFAAQGSPAHGLLMEWLAHRYPSALRFARAAAAFCARERRRSGSLTFDDLLALTARLLRRGESARRELADRWRFLLVDEFQDTDPLQAEVLFLLAGADPGQSDWRRATPRPGALFVVGDPKQSIYRFRRADISVYNAVKARFVGFGGVLELTASFRSGPALEALVNGVFGGLFPAVEDGRQAGFAPLRVRPGPRQGEGIGWYGLEPAAGGGRFSGRRISAPDAEALASWVAARIAAGERKAGDVMVLTRTRQQLAEYARALESRGVPVQLSGAGVGAEEELRELVLLLRALGDPGDAVLTVAVLEGMFFGLSHDHLFAHAAAGGTLSFLSDQPPGPGADALGAMREMGRMARALPADTAVPAIVERLGIVPLAAAGELGGPRAGALLFALDALRTASLNGASSLSEAVEVLEAALDADADAPLMPGEGHAVRVMNLHRAKGLEGRVVILAYPAAGPDHPPVRHVERGADGVARGHLLVRDSSRRGAADVLARPLRWEEHALAETACVEAEEVRLLYVAATRAMDELVVARCHKTAQTSAWNAFHAALDDPALAAELPVAVTEPLPRTVMEDDGPSILARASGLADRRREMARPGYRTEAVTGLVRRAAPEPRPRDAAESPRADARSPGRGPEWGTAVHRALEAAARGAEGDALRTLCRGALVDAERPVDEHGEPAELAELLSLVAAVHASDVWARAAAADLRLVEVPFALHLTPAEARELGVAPGGGEGDDCNLLVEGVIDLAFRESGTWTIVDYKTGAGDGTASDGALTEQYQRQVDLYGACWGRITGDAGTPTVIMLSGRASR
jgi:ATP-dependent helicase/nuclease subunit A